MDFTLDANSSAHFGRIPALDRFRGLSLCLMLAFGAAKMVTFCDFFVQLSTHDPALSWQLIDGYGFYDSIAPMFVFASALSFWAAFGSRRRKLGWSQAILSFFKRSMQLVGLGGLLAFDLVDPIGWILMALMLAVAVVWIISLARPQRAPYLRKILGKILTITGIGLIVVNYVEVGLYVFGVQAWHSAWSAIASIGVGLLFTLCIVRLSDLAKIVICIVATVFYGLVCYYSDVCSFDYFVHGGLMGSFGYSLLMLYAYTLMSLHADKKVQLSFSLVLAVAAIGAYLYIIPYKEAVNVSYVLISYLISFDVYFIISLFDKYNLSFAPLTILGRNSLTVYCLHFLMTFTYGICLNALVAYVPAGVVIQCIMFAIGMACYPLIMTLVIRALSHRNYLIRL